MAKIRFLLILAVLLTLALVLPAVPAAQTLSSQVLQLLSRVNTWTGQQTFQDLRLGNVTPADTTRRLYSTADTLYWNGSIVAGGGGGPAIHSLLSSTHGDTTAASPARGALITGQGGSPTWSRLTIGGAGTFLRSDGTDIGWGTDGSALTALNASALGSGTVPLARLSGLLDAQIGVGANIAWGKLDKGGSSLGDLTTRSATDLTSGTLPDARLSANVSLFGVGVDASEITDGAILFADWNANGCTSGQYPQYNGTAWVCGTITPGTGTVTSVGLSMPAIFSVSGSPVTGTGTLTAALATQTANLVWAGPNTGSPAAPTFRSLVYGDLPTSAAAAGTYPKVTINAQGIVTGTANQITLTTDVTGVLPLANGGTGLNAAADDSVLLSNGTAWAAAGLTNCTTALTYTAASNTFGCSSTVGTHALLSASHTDTLAASVVRGDLIVGSSVPQWTRLGLGVDGATLQSNGTDPVWQQYASFPAGVVTTAGTFTTTRFGLSLLSPSSLSTGFDWGAAFGTGVRIAASGRHTNGSEVSGQALSITAGGGPATGDEWYGLGIMAEPVLQSGTSGTHDILAAVGVSFYQVTNGGGTGVFTNSAGYYYKHGAPYSSGPQPTNQKYSFFADEGPARFDDGQFEYGRTVKQGVWQLQAYAGGNFTANGSMTWTVDSGDINANYYTLIGKTLFWTVQAANTTVGGTLNNELRVTAPGTFNQTCVGTFGYTDNGTAGTGHFTAASGTTYVALRKDLSGPNWTAATNNTIVSFSLACEIQ